MTLIERFAQFTKQESWEKENYNAKECEQIADDYAIEFAEWLSKNDLYDEILLQVSEPKELLEIFKKEKGL